MATSTNKEVINAFQTLDVSDNKNEPISFVKYKAVMKKYGINISNDIAHLFFSNPSSRGYLSINDLCSYMLECPNNNDLELRTAFNIYDKDNDGFISSGDLFETLISLGNDVKEDDISKIIQSVDIDGDGLINYDEFVIMMNK